MARTLTILADSNISHLSSYFNVQILEIDVRVVTVAGRDIDSDMLREYQPDALLVRSVTLVNEKLLKDNYSIRFVGSATIGTDHIDQVYLSKREITFANASGCSKHSVAQYVLTAIFNLYPEYRNQSINIGIIGLGNIGLTLAEYAIDMGWQVLGYDPLLSVEESTQLINNYELTCVELSEVLSESDVISLHVPLTKDTESDYPTHNMIDEDALAVMNPSALLINTARGSVIKESALLSDIKRTNRKVVLDVFEYEPIVHHEILTSLAIATPHIAGYTLEGKLRGTHMIYQSFCDCFGLSLKQDMDSLLPTNQFKWKELLSDMSKLNIFYQIMQDDEQLRSMLSADEKSGKYMVKSQDFDILRKNYQLRREWLKEVI